MEKKILIVASLDGFANSVWPTKMQQYITQKGHHVEILDTFYFGRLSNRKGTIGTYLPKPSLYGFILYCLEFLWYFIRKFLPNQAKYFGYYFITSIMKARKIIIKNIISNRYYDLIVCGSPIDSQFIAETDDICRTLLTCPAPLADELYYSNMITGDKHEKLRELETRIFKSCTYLSFHWHTLANYVKKYYKYDKDNIFIMNFGTEEASRKAEYNEKLKIIFLGYLGGHWVNFPLLSRLSKIYPIDVYGSPAPDPKYQLNYKGYAPSEVLSEYQFGLITITQDTLRREGGFSAKHLDYLAHGLPVLIPEWREYAKDLKGTVLFNENNFLNQIKYYSQREEWEFLSKEALKQARELTWENTFRVLDDILDLSETLEMPL